MELIRFQFTQPMAWVNDRDLLFFGASALLVAGAFLVAYRRRKVV